jgi:RNA polymerase sigma-70 factor (ECF subfamily)
MPSAAPSASPPLAPSAGAAVHALAFRGDDEALVAGLRRGHPGAAAAFHDRFASRMHGLLYRLLGPDTELEDVLHDAFVRALEALPRLRDPRALESWVMGVTVRTARTCIQKRARRKWLRILPPEEVPETPARACEPAESEALRATYAVLQRLPADDRIVLVLRFVAAMTVAEIAETCEVSVSTVKRRLKRAETTYLKFAESEPALEEWRAGGTP